MIRLALALGVALSNADPRSAQELSDLPVRLTFDDSWASPDEGRLAAREVLRTPDLPIDLTLEDPSIGFESPESAAAKAGHGFVLGPMAGYLRARGSDHGAWFGGVMARAYIFPALAAEGSISVHQDRFDNGDVRITQWPVQVTGLLFPFANLPVDPYVLAGAGWYYTRVHTRGSLASFKDETDKSFGAHAGAGLELRPEGPIVLFADVRYIFIRPTTDAVERADFSYWQVTLGVGFSF